MVRTTLIIIQVTIGKKKVELPDLNIKSPGNCPNQCKDNNQLLKLLFLK